MIDLGTVYSNTVIASVFPNVLAKNATGAGLTDGTEFIAAGLNNGPEFGFMQSMMAYGAGGTNAPTGTMGAPNGVSDAAGVNQIIEAMQRGFAIGPGKYVQWGLFDDPSVTLDRVLLLSNQGILIATYLDLVAETYVGDGNNPTAPFFYKSVLADGLTRDTAGPFFILPPANPTYKRQYFGDTAGALDFIVSSTVPITVLDRAVLTPYQTSEGAWRTIINISFQVSAAGGPRTGLTMTIGSITFKSTADQAITGYQNSGFGATEFCKTNKGLQTITIQHLSFSTDKYIFSADVELDSEPAFTDGHTFPWGITY